MDYCNTSKKAPEPFLNVSIQTWQPAVFTKNHDRFVRLQLNEKETEQTQKHI